MNYSLDTDTDWFSVSRSQGGLLSRSMVMRLLNLSRRQTYRLLSDGRWVVYLWQGERFYSARAVSQLNNSRRKKM
jgi:hypothetical protein